LQTLLLLNRKKMVYGIQSPPRQSPSSVYSLYLGAEANRIEEGQMGWHGNNIEFVLKMNIDFQ